jgi:GntR family transcriptional regulator
MRFQTVDRSKPEPLYHQLKCILMDSIGEGRLKPKEKLLAETMLAKQYGVSMATVRQALGEMERDGYIVRIQGRGTFVALSPVDFGPSHLDSFTLQMEARGMRPNSQVLDQAVIAAEGELAESMGVRQDAPLFRLRRLRLADGEPMGVQTAHIPLELAPGLELRDFRKEKSLYSVLVDNYGLVPARAHETHTAVAIDKDQAQTLKTVPGAPALESRRLTLLESGAVMELVFSLMRGDRHRVVLDLTTTHILSGRNRS